MAKADKRYRKYLLTVLVTVLAFNWIDRTALGLVLQAVKTDLHLTDTQLGLMTGIAFAIFYSILGIPIARWADSGNRVLITCLSAALCSLAIALCGLAAGFVQLLLIRVLVGVGEAGCAPAGHSLIAEHFTREERPQAAAIYSLGVPLSMVIGYFLAGWLNELFGWRVTFFLLGLPGLALALVAGLTLHESRSGEQHRTLGTTSRSARVSPPTPGLKEVSLTLWTNRTFRHLLIAYSVANFFVHGISQWQPAFFVRSFGLPTGTLGTWLAVIYGIGGVLGTYTGGRWASRHAHNERLHLKVASLIYISLGVVSPFIYLAPSPYIAFALLAAVSFGYFSTFGPAVAAIQTLVRAPMRATAFAILYLFVNLVGIGLGPLTVGWLSDLWHPWAAEESLRYALLALSPGYIWVAWHIWQASLTVLGDVETVQSVERHAEERPHEAPSALGYITPGRAASTSVGDRV